MKSLAVLTLLLANFVANSFAQWPVVLEGPPGLQLMNPNVSLGANGEALIAATVHLPDDNIHVFSVTLDGQIEWSGHYDEPWNQTPIDVAEDGEGGCLVFVNEVFHFHDRVRQRLKLYRFDDQGEFIYSVVVGDSMTPPNGFGPGAYLEVINGMACMAWREQFNFNDSASYRIQRTVVETGERLEGPHGRFLHPDDGGVATAVFHDSLWAVAIAGTLYFINPLDGIVQDSVVGNYLGVKELFAFEDSLIVYGGRQGLVIAIQCYDTNSAVFDTAFTPQLTLPYSLDASRLGNGIVVGYTRGQQSFYRTCTLSNDLSEEFSITDSARGGFGLQIVTGDSAVIAVWQILDSVDSVSIQQFRGGFRRWPNGRVLSPTRIESETSFDACSGNTFGWLCWRSYPNSDLLVQPADPFDTTEVAEPPMRLPEEFRLFAPYPNPFNSTTTITFILAANTEIRLSVYNTAGQLIEELLSGSFLPGTNEVHWFAPPASGIYFLKLASQSQSQIQKVIHLK